MPPPRSLTNDQPRRLAPAAQLAACVAIIAACWLIVLPLLARTPRVRDDIQRNESLGIDPSAKFYSELPAMPGIVDCLEELRRQHEGAFSATSGERGSARR